MSIPRSVLVVLGCLCVAVGSPAQCNPPGTETFDSATQAPVLTCASAVSGILPGVLPPGWINDPTNQNDWRVWSGGTFTFNTGPGGDHTSGQGNYLVLEATGCNANDVGIVNPPCFDPTGLTIPAIEFWYHMKGSTQGTLEVETWDGVQWTSQWSVSGDQGPDWNFVSVNVSPVGGQVLVRFKGTMGNGQFSDIAIDDVTFGQGSPILWNPNRPEASMDIDGVIGDPFNTKAVVNHTLYTVCTPNPHTVSSTVNLSSTLPAPTFEVMVSSAPLLPSTDPFGVTLPDGQVLNVDFFSPAASPVLFANGLTVPLFLPLPGPLSVNVTFGAPADLSVQGVVPDPAAPIGLWLTQPSELHVTPQGMPPAVPGPTGDDSTVLISLAPNPPLCWDVTGIPFYGTTFTRVHVISNGRIMFGGIAGDTDFSPTIAEALADNPFTGFWSDLVPAPGVIQATNPSTGVFRVDYQGVNYFGETAPITFGIEIDTSTGTVTLDNLDMIQPNPMMGVAGGADGDAQFLGISPGNLLGATNPGLTGFGPMLSGMPAASTDALFDFYDTTGGSGGLVTSLTTAITTIVFTPTMQSMLTPNYDWASF